jgi:hypothetical protein
MDTLARFFNRLFADHCACFRETCQINNIASQQVNKLLLTYASSFVHKFASTSNCKIIHSSGLQPNLEINSKREINFDYTNLSQHDKIQFYLDCMIEFGLVVPPSKELTENVFVYDNDNNWNNENELNIVSDKNTSNEERFYYYLFYDGNYVNWEYIQSYWKSSELPMTFITKFSALDFTLTELLDLAKMLFWFFRKAIVDNIIISIMPEEAGCLAVSAGSINLISDYDVNVYGAGSEWVSIFFHEYFFQLFGVTSDIAFDTNIYSSSFMNMISPKKYIEWYASAGCGSYRFWYVIINSNTDQGRKVTYDQHLWATLKVVKTICNLAEFGFIDAQKLYHLLAENLIWLKLVTLVTNLDNLRESADALVFALGLMKPDYRTYVNHLSLINYKGNETYYTRGAFLDVVVNQQMCKAGRSLDIDEHVYFDSMIENLADYCKHDGKEKYRNRVAIARGHLVILSLMSPKSFASLDKFLRQKNKVRSSEKDISIYTLLSIAWNICLDMIKDHESSILELQKYIHSFNRKIRTSRVQL